VGDHDAARVSRFHGNRRVVAGARKL